MSRSITTEWHACWLAECGSAGAECLNRIEPVRRATGCMHACGARDVVILIIIAMHAVSSQLKLGPANHAQYGSMFNKIGWRQLQIVVIKAWSLPFGKSVVRMIYTHTTRKICMALMKSFELKTASGSCIVGNYPFSATICRSFWKEGQLLRNISILEPKSNAAIHV